MAYAQVKVRLLAHARTAAAAVTPPIEDVQIAFPLPKSDCVRVYYGGETDPVRMGEGRFTLNSEMVGKLTMIALFLPITSLDEELAVALDAKAEAFTHALRTAIDADIRLAGGGDNTTLEDGEPDIAVVGNTRFLVVLWRAVTDYVEYPLSVLVKAAHINPPAATPEAIVDALQAVDLLDDTLVPEDATAEDVVNALIAAGLIGVGELDPLTATAEAICLLLIANGLMEP